MKGRLGGGRLVSMPYLDQGGILASGEDAATALWAAALRLVRRLGARGLETRGGVPEVGGSPPATQRFRWTLRLEGSQEDLWHSLGPKVRNQIRKSSRLGLVTRGVTVGELDDFYRIFARNMHDLGSPVHSLSFFHRVLTVFESRATLYLTSDAGGRTVAGGVALRFGDCVSVPWASSLRSTRPECPNHSLYWKILGDTLAAKRRVFDFGRSTLGTGPARFKKHWGADGEPLIWSWVDGDGTAEPGRSWTARDHATLVRLWRLLPLAVATRLGPLIRRQLPN
jgi:FemAB-related protein (PEP-CTERM system-associated)